MGKIDYRHFRRPRRILEDLEGLAGVCAGLGQPDQAAQLFGAAEALRETHFFAMPETERPTYSYLVALVLAQMDETTFSRAWAKGRAMSLEEVIAYTKEIFAKN